MRHFKYIVIFLLVATLALPALAQRRKIIKDAKALITSAKIAMRANPPRYDEAMGLLNDVLANSGPIPEAYFYRANIYGEWANKEYDPEKKLDILLNMTANYDSLGLSCEDDNVKKKLKKDCKKFTKIVDSIRVFYWKDSYNNGVSALARLDEEYIPDVKNAVDSIEEKEARAALDAAADSSILYFRACIIVEPTDYRAHEGVGIVYDRLKQYDSSAAWFIKSHEIVPDSINIIQNIAYAYIQLSKWESSIVWFKKFLEKVPDDANTISNVAICYNNLQMYDSAFAYNMKTIEVDPNNAGGHADVGQYYLLKARPYTDSVTHYQKADNAEEAKKFISLRDATFDSSAVYYKKSLELDPENLNALENFGIVCMIRGDYAESEKVFTKLSDIEPTRKEHWIDLGDSKIQLKKFEEAITPYEKAVDIDPGDARLWEILADLYKSSNMPDKAKEAEAKAEELKNL